MNKGLGHIGIQKPFSANYHYQKVVICRCRKTIASMIVIGKRHSINRCKESKTCKDFSIVVFMWYDIMNQIRQMSISKTSCSFSV